MSQNENQEKEMSAAEAKAQQKVEEASKEIETVLKKNQLALQPFIVATEFGIVPRVRLVDAKPEENEQQENDSEN